MQESVWRIALERACIKIISECPPNIEVPLGQSLIAS